MGELRRFRDFETDEPSAQNRQNRLYAFVRHTRTFPKTAAEIKDFSYAKLTREDEDIVVVLAWGADQVPVVYRSGYGAATPFSQSVHSNRILPTRLISWSSYLKGAPTNLTQQLELVGARAEKNEESSEENDGEITVTAGLGLLLKDSWSAVREYTVSWMAIWGGLVQLAAWLLGGFDAELKITTAIVILFLVSKALVHFRAGEIGLAFWRILHFPL